MLPTKIQITDLQAYLVVLEKIRKDCLIVYTLTLVDFMAIHKSHAHVPRGW